MSDFQPYNPDKDNNSEEADSRSFSPSSSANKDSLDDMKSYQPFVPDSRFTAQNSESTFAQQAADASSASESDFQSFSRPSSLSTSDDSLFSQPMSSQTTDDPNFQFENNNKQNVFQNFEDSDETVDSQAPTSFFSSNPYRNFDEQEQQKPLSRASQESEASQNFGQPRNSYNPTDYPKKDQTNIPRTRSKSKSSKTMLSRLSGKAVLTLVAITIIILLANPVIGAIVNRGQNNDKVVNSASSVSKTSSQSSSSTSSNSTQSSSSTSSTASESSSSSAQSSSSSAATTSSYTVKSGDTPYHIASVYGMTVTELYSLNGLAIGATLVPGQVLKVNGN